MAQRTVLVDDFDESEATQTVEFGYRGQQLGFLTRIRRLRMARGGIGAGQVYAPVEGQAPPAGAHAEEP
jgi:hypothetical protein